MVILFLSSLAFAESPRALLDSGKADEAISELGKQLRDAPSGDLYNYLCRAYFELGAWDAGIPNCERAVALAPDNAVYHLWLGRIYGEKADHAGFLSAAGLAKKVRGEFERAVELDPTNWEARTDLAEFYLEAPGMVGGGKDKARAQADAIAALNPAMGHWVLARLAAKNKDMVLAEREYRAAVESSHGSARAWLNLAGFYRRAGRFDDMENALRNLETKPADFPAALADGGGMLLRLNRDLPLAARLLTKYLAGPTVEEAPAFKAHEMLGQLLEKQGDPKAAAEQFRAALTLAHSYRPAIDGLRRVGG
ncbi:MAG TPA: tetratricopeptide repeat protein [Candidatus Binatia bacterium]|nr:tetratricopeptide repeat protein [Candidatus Binatia bacterium]